MSIDVAQPTEPAKPAEPAAETSAQEEISIQVEIIDQPNRDAFDARFRAASQLTTPMPPASEAFVARNAATGDILGAAYVAIRHHLGPYALVEGAPADTLSRLAAAITDQLRSTVRESVLATHADIDPAADYGLSYDIYVTSGQPAPEGFEKLAGIEVWRRRVC